MWGLGAGGSSQGYTHGVHDPTGQDTSARQLRLCPALLQLGLAIGANTCAGGAPVAGSAGQPVSAELGMVEPAGGTVTTTRSPQLEKVVTTLVPAASLDVSWTGSRERAETVRA